MPDPGRLIYVVGPSGAGKDTLIRSAKARFAADPRLRFVRRAITRPSDPEGEDHAPITVAAFEAAERAGDFAMSWRSHGLAYGIPRAIDAWLAQGTTVVMNGSREYLPTAADRYPEIEPVLVRIDPEILRARLVARGREAAEAIEARVARATAFAVGHPATVVIDNSAAPDIACAAFERLLHERDAVARGLQPA